MEVPLFYILKRGLSSEHIEAVIRILSITPCQAVIVSNLEDASLAWKFAPQVIRAGDESSARFLAVQCANETGRPVLVIGQADFVDAVYSDGRIEPLQPTFDA